MKFANVTKYIAIGFFAVGLVGCATDSETTGGGDEELGYESDMLDESDTLEGEEYAPLEETAIAEEDAESAPVDDSAVSGSSDQVVLPNKNTVHFGFDRHDLNPHDYGILNTQAAYLTSSAGRNENIIIEGHTDERGTRTYNISLGSRRAEAVRRYLVLKGVDASRIEVVSYGFEKPVNPASTLAAYKQNRRAVVVRARK